MLRRDLEAPDIAAADFGLATTGPSSAARGAAITPPSKASGRMKAIEASTASRPFPTPLYMGTPLRFMDPRLGGGVRARARAPNAVGPETL
jgi:hypothetical protein